MLLLLLLHAIVVVTNSPTVPLALDYINTMPKCLKLLVTRKAEEEKQQPRTGISCSQTSIIVQGWCAGRVWGTKSQFLYFTEVWNRTYKICDVPLSRSAWRGLAPLQKLCWNHCSSMCEQKPYPIWFSCRHKTYSVSCKHNLNWQLCCRYNSTDFTSFHCNLSFTQTTSFLGWLTIPT